MDNQNDSPPGTPELRKTNKQTEQRQSGNKVKDANAETNDASEGKTNSVKCNGARPPIREKSARDRWGKLKTTVAATNVIAPKKKTGRLDRGDSFLRKFSTRHQGEEKQDQKSEDDDCRTLRRKRTTPRVYVISPTGSLMFYWLAVVTLAVMYNLWTCIAREAFREIQKGYMAVWFGMDGLCDFIYVCDIFVQLRTGYLQQGLMVYDSSKLCWKYVKDRCFVLDLCSLFPLDFVQFYTGIHPMLRFPRFLKVYRSLRFMHLYESRTAYPNLLRVANLSHILFLGSHWFAAFYYLISEAEGFDGDWSYPKPENQFASVTRKYLASMYWSTLTLTTIGDLPPPDTNWQYVFVIVSYLIGVFIFATIVGQVGNVITNRNASRQEFERLLDGAKFYMQMHNVPPELQRRVQRWYDYVWTRGRLNCNDINSLGLLPDKLKTELALHVNLGTLKKVTIFQKCRPEFLHDLMLKMRAYIFTPGDLICRRGEVAREMFIIADGVVEILGENATVLTQMSTGDFFGEIGILNLDGGINRRTADVRSVGYSELFVLSREDVLAALKDHPDAEQIIREFGQRRLKETEEHRKMAKSTPTSPDPSSAFRNGRHSGKSKTNDQSRLGLPKVKCFQKIPEMSPKLRKIFRKKHKSEESSDTCKNPAFDKQGAITPPMPLGVIQEKDSMGNSPQSDAEDNESAKGLTLATVVLNLLRKKRELEYAAVNTSDDDTDDEFGSIKVDNIGDIVKGVSASSKKPSTDSQCTLNKSNSRKGNRWMSTKKVGHIPITSSDNSDDAISTRETSLTVPKIVLTKPTNITSSDSDDTSTSEVNENHSPTPHPARKSYLSRKSSPCISPLTPTLSDKLHRSISLPPPLDLPFDVADVSGGVSKVPDQLSHSDISGLMEYFKSSIEHRLDAIETSYKDSMSRMEKNIVLQEKLMQRVLHQCSDRSGPVPLEGDTNTVSSDSTVINIPDEKTHTDDNNSSAESNRNNVINQHVTADAHQQTHLLSPTSNCSRTGAEVSNKRSESNSPFNDMLNDDNELNFTRL